MKSIKLIFVLPILLLATKLNADEQTQHAYNKFCNGEAEARFKELDKLTEGKIAEIETLKKEINNLSAKKKILKDLTSIRDNYLRSIDSIISGKSEKTSEIKTERIGAFRNLLRNALTLNAISLLTKGRELKKDALNLEAICGKNSGNEELAICTTWWLSKRWNSIDTDKVEATLTNFAIAMDHVTDKKALYAQIDQIYNSIPKEISPGVILDVMLEKAPVLTETALKSLTRKDVENCLKDNKGCEKLIENPDKRASINTLLGQEDFSAEESLKDKYMATKNNIYVKNKEDLSAILNTYDYAGVDLINQKTKEISDYKDRLKKDSPNGFSEAGINDEDFNSFKEACTINENLGRTELTNKKKQCIESVGVLTAKIDSETKSMDQKEKELRKKLDVLKGDTKLEKTEKIKQYIAQKYARSCPQAKDGDLISNVMKIKCNDLDLSNSAADNLEDLSISFANIIGSMQANNSISRNWGELGVFSKQEINIYSNYCQNTSPEEAFAKTCQEIFKEQNRLAPLKDSKDWEEFNKKYYVEYNPRSKNGYSAYEKKSNVKILGEGFLLNVNNMYSTWVSDFQMGLQIESMTNQAIYTKQINYMNDPTSPWMLMNPYFQGNYLNTIPTTNGFNFSK